MDFVIKVICPQSDNIWGFYWLYLIGVTCIVTILFSKYMQIMKKHLFDLVTK